jgi:hypothetical protein
MLSWAVWNLSVDSVLKSLKALTQRSWVADSLIDTVKRGIAMRAWGNFSLAVLIKRRVTVSLIIVMAVCSLRQLFLPMDNKMSLVSGLGDVCLSKTAVRCLNVAPGKLSIWMSSIFLFGIRAKFESPVIIMGFLIGRDHIVALRFVGGCMQGWW